MKIYKTTNADGTVALVRAKTAAGALAFKRAQVVVDAAVPSQDELVKLALAGVKVEEATM